MSKPLYLRGFWTDDKLQFDAEGHPKKTYATGSFAVSGFDAENVSLSGNKLRIDGERFGLEFTPEGDTQKYPIPESMQYQNGEGVKRQVPKEQIHIEIEGVKGGDFGKALDAIFAGDLSELAPSLPPYWQRFARLHFQPHEELGRSSPGVTAYLMIPGASETRPMHVGGSMTPPKVLSPVQPDYTQAARRLGLNGRIQVYMWIGEDGIATHLTIMRPLGLGLDEAAIAALSKYKFQPATLNGKPVKVDMYMDVSF